MDSLIENLHYSGTTVQALAVSAGGLIGVFATLGIFFAIIFIANRVAARKSA
jgi:hypothetical protein